MKTDRLIPGIYNYCDRWCERWYSHFMFVKATRAVCGIEDMHDDYLWKTPDQSDANGSAKLAMIAAERSICAWEVIRKHWPEQGPAIIKFELHIRRFRNRLEGLFPVWEAFIRPGFDMEASAPEGLPEN